jgi:hypothetical protein
MSKLTRLTDTAAEAIRSANHATQRPGSITVPDTSDAVADLGALADRLDQLLRQLARNVEARHDLGGLTLDGFHGAELGGDPTTELADAASAITQARHASLQLAGAIRRTHNTLAHIQDNGPTSQDRR